MLAKVFLIMATKSSLLLMFLVQPAVDFYIFFNPLPNNNFRRASTGLLKCVAMHITQGLLSLFCPENSNCPRGPPFPFYAKMCPLASNFITQCNAEAPAKHLSLSCHRSNPLFDPGASQNGRALVTAVRENSLLPSHSIIRLDHRLWNVNT